MTEVFSASKTMTDFLVRVANVSEVCPQFGGDIKKLNLYR